VKNHFFGGPLFRLLVLFVLGILLAERFVLPLWFFAAAFCVCGVVALLLRSSGALAVMFLTAGFGTAQLREPVRSVPLGVRGMWEIEVCGIPANRGGYWVADGVIRAWRPLADAGSREGRPAVRVPEESRSCVPAARNRWSPASDKVVLRGDTLVSLSGGERIRCFGSVRPLSGGSAGYRRSMERRGVVGSLFLRPHDVIGCVSHSPGLHLRAARRLETRCSASDAGAVVRAMTVADRSGLTPGLRADYSRSGMAHLLAVSGLHVGIVFWLVNGVLRWVTLFRRGHLLRNLCVIAAVWGYVAAAGFPPSAVRAAVMASMLQLAMASASTYVAWNALAAAAFGMLLWNPAWLGDIGFQLSFIAVAAILAWGVPLCRRLRTGRRPVDALVDTLVVGFVASLAAAPLVSHVFGVVPTAGLLLNPVAIPLAAVVVMAGLLLLLVPVPMLLPVFRVIGEAAAGLLDRMARFVASMPGGAVDHSLSAGWTVACYGIFVVVTWAVWQYEPKKSINLPS
jgi:competence protein ComEC